MKTEPIEGSETSAFRTQTPGNYPKENILQFVSYFNEIAANSGPITKGRWPAPYKIHCCLLNVLFDNTYSRCRIYLLYDFFLELVLTILKVFTPKYLFLTLFGGFFFCILILL